MCPARPDLCPSAKRKMKKGPPPFAGDRPKTKRWCVRSERMQVRVGTRPGGQWTPLFNGVTLGGCRHQSVTEWCLDSLDFRTPWISTIWSHPIFKGDRPRKLTRDTPPRKRAHGFRSGRQVGRTGQRLRGYHPEASGRRHADRRWPPLDCQKRRSLRRGLYRPPIMTGKVSATISFRGPSGLQPPGDAGEFLG